MKKGMTYILIFSLIIIVVFFCLKYLQKKVGKDINDFYHPYRQNREVKKNNYLEKNVFFGLKNLNDGFDSESIYYFSESDFDIVLNRVEKNGIGIYGIEPWLNGEFYSVRVHEQLNAEPNDPNWYREAFSEFKKRGKNLQYSATYEIPNELIVE